jgi:hypothetical protein
MNRSERLVGLLAARRPEPVMTVARSVFPAGTPAGVDLERIVRNRIAELARIRLGSISCAPSGELMAVSAPRRSAGSGILGGEDLTHGADVDGCESGVYAIGFGESWPNRLEGVVSQGWIRVGGSRPAPKSARNPTGRRMVRPRHGAGRVIETAQDQHFGRVAWDDHPARDGLGGHPGRDPRQPARATVCG